MSVPFWGLEFLNPMHTAARHNDRPESVSLPEIDDKMVDRGSFGALKMAADLVVKCMGTTGKMEFPYLKQLPDYLPRSE